MPRLVQVSEALPGIGAPCCAGPTVLDREQVPAALDLLELTELAWHDCYGEITPSDEVIDDILACSRGDLARMARVARPADASALVAGDGGPRRERGLRLPRCAREH
jgi:hypothetical protein